MDPYDPALVPGGFGLNNTGAICYLNAFLQTLAGCSAFTRAVLENREYVSQTRTGAAVCAYVDAFAGVGPGGTLAARHPPAADTAFHSARILQALVADLAVRRKRVRFGGGQESASEALVLLLDMMEPPESDDPPSDPAGLPAAPVSTVQSVESPVTRIFLHRYRCDLHCLRCKGVVSKTTDHAVNFHLFHFDGMPDPPTTPDAFATAIERQISKTEDYLCPTCNMKTSALRVYRLTMVPEVLFCLFNLYGWGPHARRLHYFPPALKFRAADGGRLVFRLVGQVEHAGSLAGGHYWARGLRAGGQVLMLNDSGVSPSAFQPSPNTYIVAYHYASQEPPGAAAAPA
jgi:hypothetical protein